jgi:DNA-directed RNA polymerase subunit beta
MQGLLAQGRRTRRALQVDSRAQIERLHRNLEDEKRILNDERAKRLSPCSKARKLLADLHDEKTNKSCSRKGRADARLIEKLRARDLKRMKLKDKDPRLNEQIDEIEEMTSRQIAVLEKITEEKIAKLRRATNCLPASSSW